MITNARYRLLIVFTSLFLVLAAGGCYWNINAAKIACNDLDPEGGVIIDNTSVVAGENTTINFAADGIHTAQIRLHPPQDGDRITPANISLDYSDPCLTPSRHATWESYPPSWSWEGPRDVTGTITVETKDNLVPGEYQVTAIVWTGDNSLDGNTSNKETAAITVRDQ